MTPDQITAIGWATAAVLAAVFGWLERRQARKLAELSHRVERLEQELTETKGMFRTAMQCIRDLLAHIRDLRWAAGRGEALPDPPEVPERLRAEL